MSPFLPLPLCLHWGFLMCWICSITLSVWIFRPCPMRTSTPALVSGFIIGGFLTLCSFSLPDYTRPEGYLTLHKPAVILLLKELEKTDTMLVAVVMYRYTVHSACVVLHNFISQRESNEHFPFFTLPEQAWEFPWLKDFGWKLYA